VCWSAEGLVLAAVLAAIVEGCDSSTHSPGTAAEDTAKTTSAAPPKPFFPARTHTDSWGEVLKCEVTRGEWTLTRGSRSLDLDGDGRFELRWVERAGKPWLECVEPGHIARFPRVPGLGLFRHLLLTPPRALRPFEMREEGAEPLSLSTAVEVDRQSVVIARVIRPEEGGGGCVASLVTTAIHFGGGEDLPRVDSLEIEAEWVSLERGTMPLPRLPDDYYSQRAGLRRAIERLFLHERYRHPSFCAFDSIELDRDHLEWSGTSGRDLCFLAVDSLAVLVADAGLYFPSRHPRRFTSQGRWRDPDLLITLGEGGWQSKAAQFPALDPASIELPLVLDPADPDRRFLLWRRRGGFERWLAAKVVQIVPDQYCEIEWQDLKAHDLEEPRVARCREVIVVDPDGEPVPGASVIARVASRLQDLDRAKAEEQLGTLWRMDGSRRPLANSLWTAVSDRDGVAQVPVPVQALEQEVEWLAFQTDGHARIGRRKGVRNEPGTGGELVIVLLECTPARMHRPSVGGSRLPATLHLRDAAVRVLIPAQEEWLLPALDEQAWLWLDPPFHPEVFKVNLSPGACTMVDATVRTDLERRIHLVDADSGANLLRAGWRRGDPDSNGIWGGLRIAELVSQPPGAARLRFGEIFISSEFAGKEVKVEVAFDHGSVALTSAADSPRMVEIGVASTR